MDVSESAISTRPYHPGSKTQRCTCQDVKLCCSPTSTILRYSAWGQITKYEFEPGRKSISWKRPWDIERFILLLPQKPVGTYAHCHPMVSCSSNCYRQVPMEIIAINVERPENRQRLVKANLTRGSRPLPFKLHDLRPSLF